MARIIFLSVFSPGRLTRDEVEKIAARFGFIFILIRWSYYSLVFLLFRDYYQKSMVQYIHPPFGLSVETYTYWQARLAVPFGLLLMASIAAGLTVLCRFACKERPRFLKVFNILGFAYFLPFIVIQALDQVLIHFFTWPPYLAIPMHTATLIWEATAAVWIIGKINPLKTWWKIAGIVVQMAIWISLCAVFWR